MEACNPVLRLQQDIEAAWTRPAEPRWSARRTLIFVLLTNGLFWAGLVLGVRAIG